MISISTKWIAPPFISNLMHPCHLSLSRLESSLYPFWQKKSTVCGYAADFPTFSHRLPVSDPLTKWQRSHIDHLDLRGGILRSDDILMEAVGWAKIGTLNNRIIRNPLVIGYRKIHGTLKRRLQVSAPSRWLMKFLDGSTDDLASFFSKYRVNDQTFKNRIILLKCPCNQRRADQAHVVDAKNTGFVRQCENGDQGHTITSSLHH